METRVEVSRILKEHIEDKIKYHEELRLRYEASEDYEICAMHRDEIIRLKKMLNGQN